ncbi:MAG: rRNA maturation RNase YbeY [Planctomycetia bacterium]|nr:rRNA maturation RNase YbeY [Planctomycetia bacterium]
MPVRVDVALEYEPFPVDAERLRRAARMIAGDHGIERGTISIAIVDDPSIHDINRKFLDHDEPTDVVSFALEEEPGYLEGEIVASADTAARTAAELKVAPADELLLYVIHGSLHLVGHDDLTPEPRVLMRAEERKYLAKFDVELPSADETK